MARDLLAALAGYRHRFRAVAVRTGNDRNGDLTLLLLDVCHAEGWLISPHCWIPVTPELRPVCGCLGQVVRFSAAVRSYRHGDGRLDYGLCAFGDVRLPGRRA